MRSAIKSSGVTGVVGMLCLLSFTAGAQADDQNSAASARDNGASPLGSTWADAAKMPDFFTGMWMTVSGFVESDAKLNVPYTAKAQKFVDAYKPKRDIPYAE